MKVGIVVIVLAAVAAWLIVVNSERHASAVGCAAVAREIARFQATIPPPALPAEPFDGAAGEEVRFADFRGKPAVVNFWATWCAPCVREMPALESFLAAVEADGIQVLTISEDRGGVAVVRKFMGEIGVKRLPILVDRQGKILRALAIGGLPTTLLVDAAGREVGRVTGVAEWDDADVIAAVSACVKAKG